jgi:diaminohydroxyphosphoribosylaminopyrimidine deaminase/5-amino-6-(5-phosphoribosylamino)uracil reductase
MPGFMGVQPARVVLDTRQRTPTGCKLVAEAHRLQTVVITTREPAARLTDAGVTVLQVGEQDGRVDLQAALKACGSTCWSGCAAPGPTGPRV